jgi:uncharacterized protein GlcG (DUF336 family)
MSLMSDHPEDSAIYERTASYRTVTTSAAVDIIAACVRAASAMNREVAVAVVDRTGGLLAGQRPHAGTPTILKLATAKAVTAGTLGMPTAHIDAWQSDKPGVLEIMRSISDHVVVTGPGGMPIALDGTLIGGLGVSGAPGDEDDDICRNALGEIGFDIPRPGAG